MGAVGWEVPLLEGLFVLLGQGIDVATRRARVILALVVAVVTAAVAIGVYVALRRIVDTAKTELEREMFGLRTGAYMLPLAAALALATVIAMTVAHAIARRGRPPVAAPPLLS